MKKQPWIPFLALTLAVLACNLPPPPTGTLIAPGNTPASPIPSAKPPTQTPTAARLQRVVPSPSRVDPVVHQTPEARLRCIVNTHALNVRACAGLDCAPVAWLKAGAVVTVTQTSAVWWQVDTGKLSGYIKSAYCEALP